MQRDTNPRGAEGLAAYELNISCPIQRTAGSSLEVIPNGRRVVAPRDARQEAGLGQAFTEFTDIAAMRRAPRTPGRMRSRRQPPTKDER